MTEAVQALVGSIVLVGMLTHNAIASLWVCDLKAAQMNEQQSLIVTERTPPHPQTDWLINDSREIIKENSYFFLSLILFPILFYLLNFQPMSWDSLTWILR